MTSKTLFIGYGDIAQRCANILSRRGGKVVGVARTVKPMPEGAEFWQGAAQDSHIQSKLAQTPCDSVVITLTPGGREPEDYRNAYLDNVRSLVTLWQNGSAPKRVILVSSTRVYAQNAGERVDETSPTEPDSEQGRILLETEQCLLNSQIPASVVRFSGIYGPGREHLLRRVRSGIGSLKNRIGNRIHIEDAVGIVLHLLDISVSENLSQHYLGSDCEPSMDRDVTQWMSREMDDGLAESYMQKAHREALGDESGKRCDNRLLLESGYQFRYPNFREGYKTLIEEFMAR